MPADPMSAAATVGTPLPDEIAVICSFANRGRPHHRVGGLSAGEAIGEDMIGG